ncbi:hypothetical protein CC80DRAFT_426977 [Byssothecium circinans]|uniref:GH16 domain-containing protein n=1 Tax=Byssothecium circinans TaxID=147558 RepID=A0A6A5TF91_9PLEO|nr:hypothetical protein CC80DRAFT_426977 [Byssothecium circinans]
MRYLSLSHLLVLIISPLLCHADVLSSGKNCSCGFFDARTESIFTDSIVVYFNETDSLTQDFIIEDYEKTYEKDWNAIYRQGAAPSNVKFDKRDSLQLFVSPPSKGHIVKGGGIRTIRRDIQHGSFRSFVKSPRRTFRGSAISMTWQYNDTETAELSVMNTNVPSDAWVGTFVNGEFTASDLGVNFSTLLNEPAANRNYTTLDGVPSNSIVDPWDYVEYRIDWTKDFINFYIGGNLTREVLRKENPSMPSVPSPLYFKHWSTGNRFSMEGPPEQASVANIGWIRMFFNSSSMTKEGHENLVARCTLEGTCSTDDTMLRGSTPHTEIATVKWKQDNHKSIRRMPALWISIICISSSTFLLVHAFIRRAPWRKQPKVSDDNQKPAHPNQNATRSTTNPSVFPDPKNELHSRTPNPFENPDYTLHPACDSTDSTLSVTQPSSFKESKELQDDLAIEKIDPSPESSVWGGSTYIDYLAGLVAVCAVLVTVMHFCLTFVPGVVIVGAPRHHESELWASKLIAPIILNQMWLGVFFTTSVRFLVLGYLKRGDMKDIAKAAVRRTPRLMIPVASIALLQYFCIDVGATSHLRYIPSLTWSTWPYVTRYPTFGHYISEVLELIYLVPNAIPQITYNYCTGVLWTIAVQLQGTWLVLCGVIVVYEIKRPWKRMCYYSFCMVSHWYAQSWGSYLWLGLLLTDLDVTYKYKQYLHRQPRVYYPLVTLCWLCVAAGFSANLLSGWIDFNFATREHNIHPDPNTGEPMMNTANAGYPEYFVPRLNGLLFAGGMQAIVELSPAVQWVLSIRPLLVLFPHIFTIYLMHGLVFWTWGSWLMIFIANRGISYSVNVVAVGVTSYAVLFAILPIVTPVIEALGKDITALCWMSATEKPPPKRRTLFPFPDDLFVRRGKGSEDTGSGNGSLESRSGSADDVKGKGEGEKVEV